MATKLVLHLCVFFFLKVSQVSCTAAESSAPTSIFRDDVLFDVQWPGGYAKDLESKKSRIQVPSDTEHDYILPELTDQLHSEVDYSTAEYIEMKSVNDENYLCEMPHWTSLDSVNENEKEEEEKKPEELIKSLRARCTRLAMGYWTYELCHGIHVRQFHEAKEQKKEPRKPGDALDEYLLGVPVSKSSKSLATDAQLSSDTKQAKAIPKWLFNGNEYPYYGVEYGEGTPCDLKEGTPRSVTMRYICDLHSHSTGTFLHLEEVSTCKYDAVVAISYLCQNKHYRLKEDPKYSLKCYPKDGSPTKPKSLLEHEIAMAQYTQKKRIKQTKSLTNKDSKKLDDGEKKDTMEEDDSKDYDMKDRSRDFPTSRTHSDYLDENFIRSFLNGRTCLRGGSGWWQHEVCYGKFVKQIHEEAGKPPVEVTLGNWVKNGHDRWYSSSSPSKRHTKNFVIHLYMKGDVCDMTGVPRQCQVKFRCSSSSRLSEVSIYLEEPTTCNYILTVEAAFLCPLLKSTDELGMFSFPSGGIESLEKALEKGHQEKQEGADETKNKEDSEMMKTTKDITKETLKEDSTRTDRDADQSTSDPSEQPQSYDGYDSGDELDEEGNMKQKQDDGNDDKETQDLESKHGN